MKNTNEGEIDVTQRPKHLTPWDFADTHHVPDGYDMKSVPSLSEANLHILIDEHNKLVDFVNQLIDRVYLSEARK